LAAFAVSPVHAAETGALLPADTDVILTVNIRRMLEDHKNTELVQSSLEPWRLALQGDEKRLKEYYRDHDVLNVEGISEEQFLARAKRFQAFNDALGIDVFKDVERVTIAGKVDDPDSLIVVVEGRFNPEKFRTGV